MPGVRDSPEQASSFIRLFTAVFDIFHFNDSLQIKYMVLPETSFKFQGVSVF